MCEKFGRRLAIANARASHVVLLAGAIVFCLASFSLFFELRWLPYKPSSESNGCALRLGAGVAKFVTSPEWFPEERFSLQRYRPFEIQSFGAVVYEFTIEKTSKSLVIKFPMIGLSIALILVGIGWLMWVTYNRGRKVRHGIIADSGF